MENPITVNNNFGFVQATKAEQTYVPPIVEGSNGGVVSTRGFGLTADKAVVHYVPPLVVVVEGE